MPTKKRTNEQGHQMNTRETIIGRVPQVAGMEPDPRAAPPTSGRRASGQGAAGKTIRGPIPKVAGMEPDTGSMRRPAGSARTAERRRSG